MSELRGAILPTHRPVEPVRQQPGGGAGPINPAATIVAQATNPQTRAVDTRALAAMVVDARRTDPAAANAAEAQIAAQLAAGNAGDASRFAQDLRALTPANDGLRTTPPITGGGFAFSRVGADHLARGGALTAQGTQLLTSNPILTVRWEATTSAWTNDGGLSRPFADRLRAGGVEVPTGINPVPPGSVGRNSGVPVQNARNINGAAAETAIAQRYTAQGFATTQAPAAVNNVPPNRVIDVVALRPNADPRLNERVEIESKVGYTSDSGRAHTEANRDIDRLAANRTARTTGEGLETAGDALGRTGRVMSNVGRVAKPVGVVMDAIEIGGAFRQDGNTVGENTGRAVSGVVGGAAGGYGGALAGAAIGTAIFPGVGTVIGGVIGAVGGGVIGDMAGKGVFNTVRGWF